MLEKIQLTDRQIEDWLESRPGTHSAPDLLLCLFAECQCIADLCILQSVRAFLGEVRHYIVRKLGAYWGMTSVIFLCAHRNSNTFKQLYFTPWLESSNVTGPSWSRLLISTCSASSLLMAKASWSCRSSSPELCGQAWSGSPPPECEPADRLPPRLGAEGAEEAGVNLNMQ